MTRISPLADSHKTGLFGDYKNQNESDLLIIREVTNVKIYQVVQYKSSQLDINSITLNDLNFPINPGNVAENSKTRIQWNAPKTWTLLSSDEAILDQILKKYPENDFAITDQSHSRAIIQIEGKKAFDIIKKGSPLNLNDFKKNNCANSVYHGITISIDMLNDSPNKFNIMALRSFAGSFHHAITDAALEFGYKGL
tara:strand:- start:90 stop:677 length:588 start_codon:yes stop_codon:yes gene_type:complete